MRTSRPGSRRKLVVKLRNKQRRKIERMLSAGTESVRVVKRAQALRLWGQGWRSPAVASAVGLTEKAVRNIGWRFAEEGLQRALYEAPRPGAQPRLNQTEAQQIVAMVCSDPPEGYARCDWEAIRYRRPATCRSNMFISFI